MKRFALLLPSLIMTAALWGAAPAGYYNKCEGKKGAALLTALYETVGTHTTVSYSGLWTLYKTSDVYPDGKIWDMYSTKHWTYQKEQCGSNNAYVGGCYNREHSLPKSWFSKATPMYSDAYHIYPTDAKVNGQRSNYPFGECANGVSESKTDGSTKPLGKRGTSTFPGYSGIVFEPVDEYKGDFARSYFYMAAAYNTRISSWNSDMLAKNSYPVFTTWAVNLLLKWHRQDPVSQKEIDRNEAVSKQQKNRNPFIDHPDLAEHIWGDKKSEGWHENENQTPVINLPLDGTTVDFGVTAINHPVAEKISVEGMNLESAVKLSVSSNEFTLSHSSFSASNVNASNAAVTVTYKSAVAKTSAAVLTLTCGSLVTKVNLKAQAIDGIPALEATGVTEESFVAHWTPLAGDTEYQLTVSHNGTPLAGYPVKVDATAGRYVVNGLEAGTTYTYTLSSATLNSNTISVTTAVPQPSIVIMHYGTDEDVSLTALPGEPSEAEEMWLETDNLDQPVSISVNKPFEISTDRSQWSQTLIMQEMEDRFYIRLGASEAGHYETFIVATSGDCYTDDVLVEADVVDTSKPSFIETFEPEDEGEDSYSKHSYTGSATTWNCNDAGIWTSDGGYQGKRSLRFGKTTSSSITTASAKANGIGTISFFAKRYGSSDAEASIEVEYSADGGDSWQSAGTATVAATTYQEFTFPVNVKGSNLIRLRQTAGKRVNVDDISVTDCLQSGIDDIIDIKSWDAYSLGGQLVIENHGEAANFIVYNLEGMILFDQTVDGTVSLDLPTGFYLISNSRDVRRVVVK